jgi:hypothetical protein
MGGKIWSPFKRQVMRFPPTIGGPSKELIARSNAGSPTEQSELIRYEIFRSGDDRFVTTSIAAAVAASVANTASTIAIDCTFAAERRRTAR